MFLLGLKSYNQVNPKIQAGIIPPPDFGGDGLGSKMWKTATIENHLGINICDYINFQENTASKSQGHQGQVA